jgi:hypothetical protein
MGPFSIATGCLALSGEVVMALKTVSSFIRAVRAAEHDLNIISTHLKATKAT